jgi:hypothetical protein
MVARVQVEGADRLARTLTGAAVALGDLTGPSRAAGALILTRARGAAPRRSGALSGSLTATPGRAGVDIGSGLIYAGPIHYGWAGHGIAPNPFLTRSAEATQPATVAAYRAFIETTIKGVKGK